MKLHLRVRGTLAELIIETANTNIHEDITTNDGKAPQELIEQLITIANELHRFNDGSDLEFVKLIADNFLNVPERNELALIL